MIMWRRLVGVQGPHDENSGTHISLRFNYAVSIAKRLNRVIPHELAALCGRKDEGCPLLLLPWSASLYITSILLYSHRTTQIL